jgi:hypothetical protein
MFQVPCSKYVDLSSMEGDIGQTRQELYKGKRGLLRSQITGGRSRWGRSKLELSPTGITNQQRSSRLEVLNAE